MRELQTIRLVACVLLLCLSGQVAQGRGMLRSAEQKMTPLTRHVLAALASVSMLSGALTATAHEEALAPQVQQLSMSSSSSGMQGWHEQLAEENEEDNALAWSEDVTQGSGVFYLALRNNEFEHIHHVVYVGDTLTSEPMFAGIFLSGHEKDYIRLYAHDGLVTQGFMQRDVETFPDPLDLYDVITVFTIKDLNLRGRYTPVMLELFPGLEVGMGLQMLQYGVREDDPKSLLDLPLKQRSCEVLPQNIWAQVEGLGRHTCAPIKGAHGSFGAPLFYDGNMVGFFSETAPSGAHLSSGMTQALVDYITAQQANPTAISVKGKAAVTWGALKQGQ